MISVNMNRKLGKKIGVFNLPAGSTCPGATKECCTVCYAKKAEKMYPSAHASRARNLEASKGATFVTDMVKEIQDRGLKMIRLHESGDAYDQEYLDKLTSIAIALPEVRFLAYTKSFHLDWSKKPANMIIYWSTTDSSKNIPAQGCKAHIVLKGQTPTPGWETCKQGGLKDHYCGVSCMTCWKGEKSVYFNQH